MHLAGSFDPDDTISVSEGDCARPPLQVLSFCPTACRHRVTFLAPPLYWSIFPSFHRARPFFIPPHPPFDWSNSSPHIKVTKSKHSTMSVPQVNLSFPDGSKSSFKGGLFIKSVALLDICDRVANVLTALSPPLFSFLQQRMGRCTRWQDL